LVKNSLCAHLGDVNGGGKVRVNDILAIALAFGLDLGDLGYDACACHGQKIFLVTYLPVLGEEVI
jgi:hypothetical protein